MERVPEVIPGLRHTDNSSRADDSAIGFDDKKLLIEPPQNDEGRNRSGMQSQVTIRGNQLNSKLLREQSSFIEVSDDEN